MGKLQRSLSVSNLDFNCGFNFEGSLANLLSSKFKVGFEIKKSSSSYAINDGEHKKHKHHHHHHHHHHHKKPAIEMEEKQSVYELEHERFKALEASVKEEVTKANDAETVKEEAEAEEEKEGWRIRANGYGDLCAIGRSNCLEYGYEKPIEIGASYSRKRRKSHHE